MAREYTPGFIEEEDENQPQGQQVPVPATTGTAAAIPTTSGLASPNTQRKASTGFTNLKKYIQANRQNQLGNQIVKPVENKLQTAQQTLAQGQQKFQSSLAEQRNKLQNYSQNAQGALNYIEHGTPAAAPTAPVTQQATNPNKTYSELTPEEYVAESKRRHWSTASQAYQDYINSGGDPNGPNAPSHTPNTIPGTTSPHGTGVYNNNNSFYNDLLNKGTERYLTPSTTASIAVAPAAIAKPVAPTRTWDADYDQQLSAYNSSMDAYNQNELARKAFQDKANLAAQTSLQDLRNYEYSGPTALENADKIANQQYEIQDFARNTRNEQGRGAILQTLFGRSGQYSGGAKNLDNLLLGQDKEALNKLDNIRSQSANLSQELKNTDIRNTADLAQTRGLIDSEKAQNLQKMKALQGSLYEKLQAEAAAANLANKADAGEVSNDELRDWLENRAGYELTSLPAPGSVGLPVEDQPKNYLNLFKNNNFESHQKFDPNEQFERKISGEMNFGQPNKQQAIVGIDKLKPLFKESYQDNSAESINREVLDRRNVLSNILQDGSNLTPKEKQEIEVAMNDQLLTKLKETPKMSRSNFAENFGGGHPGQEGIQVLQNWQELGFKNPWEAMQETGVTLNSDFHIFSNEHPIGWTDEGGGNLVMSSGRGIPWQTYLNSVRSAGWNNNTSAATVAKRLQQKYIQDRMKALGLEGKVQMVEE